ncbi:antitoxin [Streptomyces fradiae]|uniref:antitoxin n=1 Tax=Streptomyces fradiae TaxID=1906 RepID=UPI0033F9D971
MFDSLRNLAGLTDPQRLKDLGDKAEDLAATHGEAIAQGLQKAGDLVDARTDGRYTDRIEAGVDRARSLVQRLGERKSAD